MILTKACISTRVSDFILVGSTALAILNSMFCAIAIGSPIPAIGRGGLFINIITAAAAWVVLMKGSREGWEQILVFILLFSVIHFLLICNLISVAVAGF